MPRFVLLHHECPAAMGKPSHWDLMLERDGVLATWSLLTLPGSWQQGATFSSAPAASESLGATRLADHRLAYLDYEGPVSGDRGTVSRVDRGEYRVLGESEGALRVELRGDVLHAEVELLRAEGDEWRLVIGGAPLGRSR